MCAVPDVVNIWTTCYSANMYLVADVVRTYALV